MVDAYVRERRKELNVRERRKELNINSSRYINLFIDNNAIFRSLIYRIFNYSLLLELTRAVGGNSSDVLWRFVKKKTPTVSPQDNPDLDQLIKYVFSYYQDHHKSPKVYRDPLEKEKAPLRELKTFLENFENCSQTTNLENHTIQIKHFNN